MGKTKTRFVLPTLAILLAVTVIFNVIPISNAAIGAGSYSTWGPLTGRIDITVYWVDVTSPGLDVFIFTDTQYSAWLINTSQDPVSYIGTAHDVIGSGSLTGLLNPSIDYYVVFSNVNGESAVGYSTLGNQSDLIPGFEFVIVLFGLLVLIGMAHFLREKSIRSIRRL